ncbi:MAG: hypothetical protein L6422_07845 [Candidatus Marinimicrobia bacterium]|nr:hypothetical protein [bacterium]MCG2716182.1 hypothetical protein [Candidatus Neomarinimicrobiota bacterium]
MKLRFNTIIVGLLILSSLSTAETAPKYEFRAAWVATVLRLDWPTSSDSIHSEISID